MAGLPTELAQMAGLSTESAQMGELSTALAQTAYPCQARRDHQRQSPAHTQ